LAIDYPPFEARRPLYEGRSAEELALPDFGPRAPRELQARRADAPKQPPHPGVANVTAARLFDDHRDRPHRLRHALCRVLATSPTRIRPLAHAREVAIRATPRFVDLDGDGRKDLLIADLGGFPRPTAVGRVTAAQRPDATFEPITLLENVGRVADVRAADFRGSGSSTWSSASSAGAGTARSFIWKTTRPTGRSQTSCRTHR